ncbi:glycosyltransferase family 2 protein [Tamlana crocina]|uniref:Glycosyltransferase n=1 Tax=Tamlana crocina TaxID=393006 RepID=A0ABX1DDD8_9FLAO|nr:glycosyltransferase [Tamlana crocina]NJX15033.1 glycosyltransferase [Tamlana crocina]
MTSPLVSICIPTYNGAEFLEEALNSAINQTYDNLEIIVSDDNSKDGTLKIIENYKSETNIPIQVYKHNPSGIGANWNNCIEKSNGDYIKFLFQDDLLAPSCIEKMVIQAEKSSKIGMVYSKRYIRYNSKNDKHKSWVENYSILHRNWNDLEILGNKIYKGRELLRNENLLSFPKNKIGEPTAVLLRKSIFKKVGFFSESLKQSLDVEFWCRLMKFYDAVFIDEKLVTFRLHDGQATNVNMENNQLDENFLLSRSIYKHLFWQLDPKTQEALFYKHNTVSIFIKRLINLFKRLKKRFNKGSNQSNT